MKKACKRLFTTLVLLIVALIILAIVYLIFIGPAANDGQAQEAEQQLLTMEMPEKTEIVESYAYCGNTSGTGNHVEIWAGILIKTDLSETQIRSFFDELNCYNTTRNETQSYELEECKYFDCLKSIAKYDGYYIIYKYADAFTQWDMRGH